jgi:hypothetical protein
MKFFRTVERSSPGVDIRRRFFLFGAAAAAAALIVPAPKRFFIAKPPPLIIARPDRPFDLPLQQMLDLLSKLDGQKVELSGIPRWLAIDKQWYDQAVGTTWSTP